MTVHIHTDGPIPGPHSLLTLSSAAYCGSVVTPRERAGAPVGQHHTLAGGDLITGPYTVADAMAAGKKAATVMDRYLRGQDLIQRPIPGLPDVFIEPAERHEEDHEEIPRAEPPTISVDARKKSLAEVEMSLSVEEATAEARRCLRCDLAFTRCAENGSSSEAATQGNRV